MPSGLQRKRGRHKPLCAASRLRLQAMASLQKASRAEFSQQYFLVAAETCLQIFRFVIGALRPVSGQSRSVVEWALGRITFLTMQEPAPRFPLPKENKLSRSLWHQNEEAVSRFTDSWKGAMTHPGDFSKGSGVEVGFEQIRRLRQRITRDRRKRLTRPLDFSLQQLKRQKQPFKHTGRTFKRGRLA